MVMFFNYIKNCIIYLLLFSCSFNSSMVFAMQPEGHSESNMITPWIAPAASFAIGRYCPEIAEGMLPRFLPNDLLAHSLVPPILHYGGYGVSAHLVARNLNIDYSDLFKKKECKDLVKKSLNFIPAALCHPVVARATTDLCIHMTRNYLSTPNSQFLQNYGAQAIMATGAAGTLYLVNRNLLNRTLLQKSKKLLKDSRPYLFVLPLLGTYKRDVIHDALMSRVSDYIGPTLRSDISWGLDKGLLIGGVGLTLYLLAFETFGFASNRYLRKKMQEVRQAFGRLQNFIADRLSTCADQLVQNSEIVRKTTEDQLQQQTAQEVARKSELQKTTGALRQVHEQNKASQDAIAALLRIAQNLASETRTIALISLEVSANLAQLKQGHATTMSQLQDNYKNMSAEFLRLMAENDKSIAQKIHAIEEICQSDSQTIVEISTKLSELIALLNQENQTYNLTEDRIDRIAVTLTSISLRNNQMSHNLALMMVELDKTPGNPNAMDVDAGK